jgi:hypothetical protein
VVIGDLSDQEEVGEDDTQQESSQEESDVLEVGWKY